MTISKQEFKKITNSIFEKYYWMVVALDWNYWKLVNWN